MSSNSRVYAKIDLDAVEYNLQSMRDNLKKCIHMRQSFQEDRNRELQLQGH